MGCGGGVNYYSLRFSHTCKPSPRVTNTCNLTDPKLVGYKIMRGSRNFFQAGGGGGVGGRGSMPDGQKWTTYFFLSSTYFTVYRGCPMVWLQRKLFLFRGSRGGLTFSRRGGGPTFSRGGGVLIIIFKETHITCDFLGGPDPKSPLPLWIRTCKIAI